MDLPSADGDSRSEGIASYLKPDGKDFWFASAMRLTADLHYLKPDEKTSGSLLQCMTADLRKPEE